MKNKLSINRKSIVLAIVLNLTVVINANSNELDETFGAFGLVEINVSHHDLAYDIEIDQTGNIYVSGSTKLDDEHKNNVFVSRIHSDGTLDETYGGFGGAPAGTVVADYQLQRDNAARIDLLDDGRVLAVRHFPSSGWVLMMFDADGRLDYEFGSSGKMSLHQYGNDFPRDLEVVDGKIVIWSSLRMARLNMDGSFDASFGDNGVVHFEELLGEAVGATSVVFADGNILVNSSQYFGPIVYPGDLKVFSMNQFGDLNPGFGVGGVITKPNPASYWNKGLAFNDGMLTVGMGNKIMRFDTQGIADASFGVGGTVDLGINVSVQQIILQPFGTTTIALNWNSFTIDNEYIAVRLEADGQLDSTFGNQSGYHRQQLGSKATLKSIFGHTNGKVLMVGDYKLPGNGPRNVMLLRTDPWVQPGGGGGGVGGGFQNGGAHSNGSGGLTNGN